MHDRFSTALSTGLSTTREQPSAAASHSALLTEGEAFPANAGVLSTLCLAPHPALRADLSPQKRGEVEEVSTLQLNSHCPD